MAPDFAQQPREAQSPRALELSHSFRQRSGASFSARQPTFEPRYPIVGNSETLYRFSKFAIRLIGGLA